MKFWNELSLKVKTMLVMILVVTTVSIVSLLLFLKATNDIIYSEYGTYCSDIASSVASSLNVKDVKTLKAEALRVYRDIPADETYTTDQEGEPGYREYLSKFSFLVVTKEYRSIRNTLRKIQGVTNVECLYLTWPEIETGRMIYLVDAAYSDIWPPGSLEELHDTDFKTDGDIRSGFDILAGEDDDGNRIVTTAMPVTDSYDQIIAYACLDYSVEELQTQRTRSAIFVILILILLAVLASYLSIRLVDRQLVKPINTLSEAAVGYVSDRNRSGKHLHRFADLDIHTGGEIETLARSFVRMESDINEYIDTLLSTRSELDSTKEYAEEMEKNALTDSLTGVRNKRAYKAAVANLNADIIQGVAKFGIAVIDLNSLKSINDNYGHECGDEAIKHICHVVCDVFTHSPVYRFGGDEFIVLLRNRDLENIKDLITEFRSKIAALNADPDAKPWERVTAAFGYSVFDPDTDSDVQSVFSRADSAMYEDKQKAPRQ